MAVKLEQLQEDINQTSGKTRHRKSKTSNNKKRQEKE